jgi:DNA-binding winged helix-turn-helix (wHTH) protein
VSPVTLSRTKGLVLCQYRDACDAQHHMHQVISRLWYEGWRGPTEGAMALSWSFPPFRLDLAMGSLWRDDELVPLPPKPFAVLAALVVHAGQVVTKEALFEAAWPDRAVTDGVLKGCIRQIRRALGERAGMASSIATVHRRGYRFCIPSTLVEAPGSGTPSDGRITTSDFLVPSAVMAEPLSGPIGREAELAHPFSLALALSYAAILHQFRREAQATHERTAAATALCREQGFAYHLTWGPILQGWVLAEQGQDNEGMALMRQGMVALQATGAQRRVPYYLALQAETCGNIGQIALGRGFLADASAQARQTGEQWWEAEVYGLQRELLLRSDGRGVEPGVSTPDTRFRTPEAEVCFRQALAVARQQQAKSLELRAAMSLSRLWQQQGKWDAARELLVPIYGWFSEGFDTAALQEAKAVARDEGQGASASAWD